MFSAEYTNRLDDVLHVHATTYATAREAWSALARTGTFPITPSLIEQAYGMTDGGTLFVPHADEAASPREHEHDGWDVTVREVWCEWFALCDREATGFIAHPILGTVPICDRCRAKSGEPTTQLD